MARKRRPIDIADLWQIFVRRRWWILSSSFIVIALTIGIVSKLPKVYRSETLIVVEPQTVPPDFVKPTVSTNVSDRLEMIREEVLSHSQLQRVIDQFNLYREPGPQSKLLRILLRSDLLTQEDKVLQMQRDITVETIVNEDSREKAVGAFRISYEGSDPSLVQQVTGQLASLFIEQNLKVREQQAQGTDEFIETQLNTARQALEAQEKRLNDFRARNMGTLPEQQAANLQVMGQLQMLLQSNADARAHAEEQRAYLQSLLSATTKHQPAEAHAVEDAHLQDLRTQLLIDEQKYQPNHPDILFLHREIKALEQQQSEQQQSKSDKTSAPAPSASTTASTDQLQSQIAALDDEIKVRIARQSELEKKVQGIQAQVGVLPAVEQELAKITRDYDISKSNYQSLLQKKDAASMAAEMERRAKGEQFRIIDPASYPEKPYKPDVTQLTLLGCLAGVVGGCALGFLLDYKDAGIYDERDAAFVLSLPSLASLPLLPALKSKFSLSKSRDRSRLVTIGSSLKAEDLPVDSPEVKPEVESKTVSSPSGEPSPVPNIGSVPEPPRTIAESLRKALAIDAPDGPELPAPEVPRLGVLTIEDPSQALIMLTGGGVVGEDAAFVQEQFRIVRTRLLELMRVRAIRTVMITSAVEGEGKTIVAVNLALAMSKLQGMKVLLVDADLRKASLGTLLNTVPSAGLSTYLQNGKRLQDVCWQINANLSVVLTPKLKENSAELLNGDRMRHFLDEATTNYDLVVVDAPPVLPVADAQILTSLVDAVIMVVRSGACPGDLLCDAAGLLQPKAVGVVVNAVRLRRKNYYYSYYQKAKTP